MSFHRGNKDGKHYWLTPKELYDQFNKEFKFDFDPCPHPKPDAFCGLDADWGHSNWVNPPFGSILKDGKKKGPTAWARKAIAEHEKGKDVVLVYPLDKWVHYLLNAGAELRSLGDVKWCATEDSQPGKGIGRFTMAFILNGQKVRSDADKLAEALNDLINSTDLKYYTTSQYDHDQAKKALARYIKHRDKCATP